MTPKISVLIPLYNRKQYAADCINSVLNQTFQDFEILICDDFSTDGVFEFVRENFSDGRIKLFKNEKNIGELRTINLLAKDAQGKYLTILHNDDLYLPNALQILYDTAEKFGADAVHSANFLTSNGNGVIENNAQLRRVSFDRVPAQKIEVLQLEPLQKFNEWFEGRIFQDLQYNIFNRKFILDEKIFVKDSVWALMEVSLHWIMAAKIIVKTPEIFYIRRENPYSQTNTQFKLENEIVKRIEHFRHLDKFISQFELFRDNDELQYKIKARIFSYFENLNFEKLPSYGDARFAKLYNSIEGTFRKYFGENAIYLAMMYHWAHAMHFNQNKFQDVLQNFFKILGKNI